MRDIIPVMNSEEDKQLDDEDDGPTANNRIAWVS